MKIEQIIQKINEHYPPELAYEWDNSGLVLGDKTREAHKIMLTLDVTPQVLEEASTENCDLIISHHPLIFGGIKSITADSRTGKMLLFAAERKIAVFTAHTNADTAENGINTRLAKILGLENATVIEPTGENTGLGRIGDINPETLEAFCNRVKNALKTPFVRFCGNGKQTIKKVAVGSGSCSSLIPQAIEKGADVIVTADLKYHTCLDFASDNFSVIDAGHFPTENMIKEMFAEILEGENLIFSSQKDVFEVI